MPSNTVRHWLLVVLLIAVCASPMVNQQVESLQDDANVLQSGTLQTSVSLSSGWTTGGDEITITGSGFTDLDDTNVSYDGINHQWAPSNLDMSSQAGRWNAIGVDSNGHIHVVQIKDGNYQIRHSYNNGSGWNSVKISDCGNTYCWDIHMVIDANDHIHLAYTTYTTWDETLVYMNYDGTTWTKETVSNSAHFGPIGIAVDSNNNPHISYAIDGPDQCGNGLRVASYTGTAWSYHTAASGANRGCESSIVIDKNDHKYVAYQDRSSSKLMIATDKSGSWDSYLVDTGTTQSNMYPGYMTSIAIDHDGIFHIAHFDDKEDDLRYAVGTPNTGWQKAIVDSSGHTGRDPSIAIDAANQPHIVYHTWTGGNLKYATYDPTIPDWKVSTIASNADVGEGNSIYIDGNGIMHVAFNDDDAEILKYTTKSTGVVVTNEVTVKFGQLGSVTGDVVDDSTIQLTTPAVANPGNVTISIIDVNGDEHQLSSTFEFIDQNDLDGDGIPNTNDDCPEVAGTSNQDVNGCPDDDGDGYSNAADAFPNDANEWLDSDGDGVGNNADAFPNDASETTDSDGDGVGDNSDAFPMNAFEQLDSDGDGVGDNSDDFPNDATETKDTDGDGVGDNADVFPMNAFEQFDSDGDGVGDNSDAFPSNAFEQYDFDGDGVGDNTDAFPNDPNETTDSDGDGIGDNSDLFPNDGNETLDSDGDGIGDNSDQCPDSEESAVVNDDGCSIEVDSDGDGVMDYEDLCPDVNATLLDNNGDGCLDDTDNDGIIDSEDECPLTDSSANVSAIGCSDKQLMLMDTDADGVSDFDDACPETPSGDTVDAFGCTIENSNEDDSATFGFDSLLSGENRQVTTTVGVSALLLAFFSILQTNAVAAILPDTFRWVQVLRKNYKLTKEEMNELTYLQSITQAYYTNPQELANELNQLKADLTGRYANNEIKKKTREKLFTLIEDLLASSPSELQHIAHNEAYFGLAGSIDTEERTELLNQKLAMESQTDERPSVNERGVVNDDGFEWLESAHGNGLWWYREANTNQEWKKWE